MGLVARYALASVMLVVIAETAKRSARLGALVAALPLVTIITLVVLYSGGEKTAKLSEFSVYTFWYVLITLPLLLIFPWLLGRIGFWWALVGSIAATMAIFAATAGFLQRFGVKLL
jgi:hypothetical protein